MAERDPDETPIGEVAKRFGLTLRCLRFWEEKRLVRPQRRNTARLYSDADIELVGRIQLWSRAGFELREIAILLTLGPGPRAQRIDRRLIEIESAMLDQHAAIKTLREGGDG